MKPAVKEFLFSQKKRKIYKNNDNKLLHSAAPMECGFSRENIFGCGEKKKVWWLIHLITKY